MHRVSALDGSFGSERSLQPELGLHLGSKPIVKVQPLNQIAILLGTYNGQDYLAEQLESFESQMHANWVVWASDDGSTDNTYSILEHYKKKWPQNRLTIQPGPGRGFVANFLSLTCNKNITADFYAYSDQDDIWDSDKLSRAVRWLETIPSDVPALYCARTRLVDADNKTIGLSPLFAKPPSFANALIQSIAGGNTMVFNNAARQLLCLAGEKLPVVTHDWWAYIVVTGCGGKVFYDADPTLGYRQHASNLVGSNSSWVARWKRIYLLFQGRLREWNEGNISALLLLQEKLTPENSEKLHEFVKAREMSLIPRLIHLKRSGVYRQSIFDNLGLTVAAILGKI